MKDNDTLYWVWLAEKCGVACREFDRLIREFENPFEIYSLEDYEIAHLGLGAGLAARLCQKDLRSSQDILDTCRRDGIDIISYGDARYPDRLKLIQDPPVVLYCKGHFPNFDAMLCVGVVGTRKMTEYGRQNAYKIGYELASVGICTVSGLALGIDGVSECGTLAAGGRTVAVLGCGVNYDYPKHHTTLRREIINHGAVISEYPPDAEPTKYNFPKRNRIVSGLSQGVVVVEAAAKSGALITADYALAHGRDVFALPGKVGDVGAAGPNKLITQGTHIILSAADVIKYYSFLYKDVINPKLLEVAQRKMPKIDDALRRCGMYYCLGRDEALTEPTYEVKGSNKWTDKKTPPLKDIREESVGAVKEEAEQLPTMDATTRRVFEAMPKQRPIGPDGIVLEGVSTTEIITALTMLEIQGLIEPLPGGLYARKK